MKNIYCTAKLDLDEIKDSLLDYLSNKQFVEFIMGCIDESPELEVIVPLLQKKLKQYKLDENQS